MFIFLGLLIFLSQECEICVYRECCFFRDRDYFFYWLAVFLFHVGSVSFSVWQCFYVWLAGFLCPVGGVLLGFVVFLWLNCCLVVSLNLVNACSSEIVVSLLRIAGCSFKFVVFFSDWWFVLFGSVFVSFSGCWFVFPMLMVVLLGLVVFLPWASGFVSSGGR